MSFLLQIILNLQIKLIIKARANQYYKNLPTANKVTIVIFNKHESASYYNIILTNRGLPREPLQYYCISLNYTAYIPLYYILLFPYSDCSWYQGIQLCSNSCTCQHNTFFNKFIFSFTFLSVIALNQYYSPFSSCFSSILLIPGLYLTKISLTRFILISLVSIQTYIMVL